MLTLSIFFPVLCGREQDNVEETKTMTCMIYAYPKIEKLSCQQPIIIISFRRLRKGVMMYFFEASSVVCKSTASARFVSLVSEVNLN